MSYVISYSSQKETLVLAQTKLDFSRLTGKIYHASQQVITYRRRNPTMTDAELRTLAESVAVRLGLDYLNGDVEPMVVAAILAMSTSGIEEATRAKALEDAWEAYDDSWERRILH